MKKMVMKTGKKNGNSKINEPEDVKRIKARE